MNADINEGPHPAYADPELLRLAMRRFASGVTIVTAQADGVQVGITVSAFTSISLDPPVVMISVNSSSSAAPVILKAGHFAVHILSREQEDLSERFAQTLEWSAKLGDVQWESGHSGAPIITGTSAVLDCAVLQSTVIGTHTVVFGRVLAIEMIPEPNSKT